MVFATPQIQAKTLAKNLVKHLAENPEHFVPKIDRKLSENHLQTLQKTSLKLFPSTRNLQILGKSFR